MKPLSCLLFCCGIVLAVPIVAQTQLRAPEAHTWKISFQLGYDRNSPALKRFPAFQTLPYSVEMQITRNVCMKVADLVMTKTTARRAGLTFGPGGYKHYRLAPSAQLDVIGTHDQIVQLEEEIGYLLRQNEVIASSIAPSGKVRALDIVATDGANLHEAARLQEFWTRLGEMNLRVYQGFLPFRKGKLYGIRIINTEDPWTDADYPEFLTAVDAAGRELGLDLTATPLHVEFDSEQNRWKDHPDGSVYLAGLRKQGAAKIAHDLPGAPKAQTDQWVVTAFRRYVGAK